MKPSIPGIVGFAMLASITQVHATPLQDFEMAICKAIYAKWQWPADAVLAGEIGNTMLQFEYYEGKASDIKLVKSGGMTKIDASFVRALKAAQLPSQPDWLGNKPLFVNATLIAPLGEPNGCKQGAVELIQAPTQANQPKP